MKLSKKALTIIDAAQYRAYGLGYAQAVEDMQEWFTACLPGVVMSQLIREVGGGRWLSMSSRSQAARARHGGCMSASCGAGIASIAANMT